MNSSKPFDSLRGSREIFESHLPSDNPPILRGIFAYGGFDPKTAEMVNAYNETTIHHVLLLAPDNSNSYWNVVSSRLSIRLKQAALAEEQRWALEMWTCQERQKAVERPLRVQREGVTDLAKQILMALQNLNTARSDS